jgi:hypothetical protein
MWKVKIAIETNTLHISYVESENEFKAKKFSVCHAALPEVFG